MHFRKLSLFDHWKGKVTCMLSRVMEHLHNTHPANECGDYIAYKCVNVYAWQYSTWWAVTFAPWSASPNKAPTTHHHWYVWHMLVRMYCYAKSAAEDYTVIAVNRESWIVGGGDRKADAVSWCKHIGSVPKWHSNLVHLISTYTHNTSFIDITIHRQKWNDKQLPLVKQVSMDPNVRAYYTAIQHLRRKQAHTRHVNRGLTPFTPTHAQGTILNQTSFTRGVHIRNTNLSTKRIKGTIIAHFIVYYTVRQISK